MTRIWAHRGASSAAPENSMRAFRLALTMGADGIEFDARFSDDLVPFVLHDKKLDRTTNEAGSISEFSAAKLAELGVPSLSDVLSEFAASGLEFNIEVKPTKQASAVCATLLEVVDAHSVADRCWVSSFDPDVLRAIGPRVRTGLLVHRAANRPLKAASDLGCTAIHPHRALVTPTFLAKARHRELRVHPWTVNKVSELARLLEVGVDAVITDVPDVALQVRTLTEPAEKEGQP